MFNKNNFTWSGTFMIKDKIGNRRQNYTNQHYVRIFKLISSQNGKHFHVTRVVFKTTEKKTERMKMSHRANENVSIGGA